MNAKKVLFVLTVCFAVMAAPVKSGIPEPDAILYGAIRISGILQTANNTDVVVIARVQAGQTSRIVATYRMGDNIAAGFRYVLRIRLESLADGSIQSANAALVGQTVQIFVKKGSQPEVFARQFVVPREGTIQLLNMDTGSPPGNCSLVNPSVNGQDHVKFAGCLGGPTSTLGSGCECSDLDGDNDADLRDWAFFQRLAGP